MNKQISDTNQIRIFESGSDVMKETIKPVLQFNEYSCEEMKRSYDSLDSVEKIYKDCLDNAKTPEERTIWIKALVEEPDKQRAHIESEAEKNRYMVIKVVSGVTVAVTVLVFAVSGGKPSKILKTFGIKLLK